MILYSTPYKDSSVASYRVTYMAVVSTDKHLELATQMMYAFSQTIRIAIHTQNVSLNLVILR